MSDFAQRFNSFVLLKYARKLGTHHWVPRRDDPGLAAKYKCEKCKVELILPNCELPPDIPGEFVPVDIEISCAAREVYRPPEIKWFVMANLFYNGFQIWFCLCRKCSQEEFVHTCNETLMRKILC